MILKKSSRKKERRKGPVGLLLMGLSCIGIGTALPAMESRAAVYGNGTADSPAYGPLAAGDVLTPESYVKNLSSTDGQKIYLERIYEAKEYHAAADAGSGHFSDGSSEIRIAAAYGSRLKEAIDRYLSEIPRLEGKYFSGWYLPGNHRQASVEEDGRIRAGAAYSCVVGENTLFLIAGDDEEDLSGAELNSSGLPLIHAIWRNNSGFVPDGNEAQLLPSVGSEPEDLWSIQNRNTMALEKRTGFGNTAAYSAEYGMTSYQYGRIRLNAKTDYAVNYCWYRKRADEADYGEPVQEGTKAYRLNLNELSRSDDNAAVRCVVTIGEESEEETEEELRERQLVYETRIRVYWLPEITGTCISADGRELA